jgi:hypothetical protein
MAVFTKNLDVAVDSGIVSLSVRVTEEMVVVKKIPVTEFDALIAIYKAKKDEAE